MFVELYGTDWCAGCMAMRKFLTSHDVPHTYTRLPPGERGWQITERATGRRAVPFTEVNGSVKSVAECKALVQSAGYRARPLTQDELDEIE